jgi:ATP:ADP antiporter, AAA family
MRDKVCTLLGISPGEESMVSMLLTQSILLGIFIGAFDISAHSLFLSVFDEKMMARAYIISGITGLILTILFSRFRGRAKFNTFSSLSLVFLGIITLSLYFLLKISQAQWAIFLVFIMFGPLNLLVLMVYRNLTDNYLTGRHDNSILELSDTSLVAGIIVISFLIPALLYTGLHVSVILFISAASVIVSTLIHVVKGTKVNRAISKDSKTHEEADTRSSLFTELLKDNYLRTILFFAVFSVITAFVLQYLFMAVAREQYPLAENLAGFLGFFTGSVMLIVLFLRRFVFKYVLYNYGIKVCLIVTPVLISVFTILIIFAGSVIGYSPDSISGFVIFFILLATTRMISKSLKDSFESSSLKVVFESTERKVKSHLHETITGTVNEVTVIAVGLLLSLLGLFSFMKLIHFSFLLFIIASVWIYFAFITFKKYRESIVRVTESIGFKPSADLTINNQDSLTHKFSAYLAFRKDYFSLISGDYSPLSIRSNRLYFEKIIEYAETRGDINLIPVLNKTAINISLDENVRQHASEALKSLQKNSSLSRSDDEKLSEASKTLAGTRRPQTTEILRLFRDSSVESKRLAIFMIGKFRLSDLLAEVCQCLSIPALAVDAAEVLNSFGAGVEDQLVRYFLISSGNARLSKAILRLLGKSCTKETSGFLFSRLWSNSRQLKEIAAKCLINCNFIPVGEEKERLNKLTSETIGIITWYLSARISLEKEKDEFMLKKINNEIDRWNNFLFNILSITYNSGSIAKILENIDAGKVENISYALEMTDIVVSDSIKPKLISLLDLVPDDVKLRNLFQFYPGDIPSRKKLLEDIINHDYNIVSLWTKACALRSIPVIDNNDLGESVTALLFSPEEIIQEEAANLIARSNHDLYFSTSARLPESVRKRLDTIVNGKTEQSEFLFTKVKFLSSLFGSIVEDDLLSLAADMKYSTDYVAGSAAFAEGSVVWFLSGDDKPAGVRVQYNGESGKYDAELHSGGKRGFYFLSLITIEQYYYQFPDKSHEIVKYIDNNEE